MARPVRARWMPEATLTAWTAAAGGQVSDLQLSQAASVARGLGAGKLLSGGVMAARTGDQDGAIRAYRHYLALRTDPDPELVPEVERVRAALDELLAEHGIRQP
jgi:hypothetical protein